MEYLLVNEDENVMQALDVFERDEGGWAAVPADDPYGESIFDDPPESEAEVFDLLDAGGWHRA